MQQSSHSRSQEKAVAAELEDEQRLLSTVVRAHLDTCDFTREKVAPVLARARETPNYTACPPTLVSVIGVLMCYYCVTQVTPRDFVLINSTLPLRTRKLRVPDVLEQVLYCIPSLMKDVWCSSDIRRVFGACHK